MPEWIDTSGCVVNHPGAYQFVAASLAIGSVCIAWTEGRGTHHDLVFALSKTHAGIAGGGMHRPDLLYVGVMRIGCFGFGIRSDRTLVGGDVSEKLNVTEGVTADSLAEFINGVIAALKGAE